MDKLALTSLLRCAKAPIAGVRLLGIDKSQWTYYYAVKTTHDNSDDTWKLVSQLICKYYSSFFGRGCARMSGQSYEGLPVEFKLRNPQLPGAIATTFWGVGGSSDIYLLEADEILFSIARS